MTDNTMTLRDYLDQVAERLMANRTPASHVRFEVPSSIAPGIVPHKTPYISIRLSGSDDRGLFLFPGLSASECMADCEQWLTKFERKAA